MRHTDQQIEQAAERFDRVTAAPDPAVARIGGLADLRAVAVAAQAVKTDDAHLRDAVRTAREHGRSWNQVAAALGVSRQAARQRYADTVNR